MTPKSFMTNFWGPLHVHQGLSAARNVGIAEASSDIVFHLDAAATVGLVDTDLHGIRHIIGIHDDMAFRISRRTPHCLDQ